MKKVVFAASLVGIIVLGFTFVCGASFCSAQASTLVSGVINSNTTWTKANSPYTLAGNVFVNVGVSLTIGPGATVNFGHYNLYVNGTLVAKGTSGDRISLNLNSGLISFNPSSENWTEQTGSGCLIENAVINSTSGNAVDITSSSPKIANCSIVGEVYTIQGSPIISYNNFTSGSFGVRVSGGSPYISDNIIVKYSEGIYVGPAQGLIPVLGTSTIVRNVIANNTSSGIYLALESHAIIQNNTITGSYTGVDGAPFWSTVIYNNILNNTLNIAGIGGPSGGVVNASYNWWGTTSQVQIVQKIIGAVNYIPFLNTSYNGLSGILSPTPNPTLTSSPTPTSSTPPTLGPTSITSPSTSEMPTLTPIPTQSAAQPPNNVSNNQTSSPVSPTATQTPNAFPSTQTPSQGFPSPSMAIVSPSPTLAVSPTMTPLVFPTQQSIILPSPTPDNTQVNFVSKLILVGLCVAAIVVALLVYLDKRKD